MSLDKYRNFEDFLNAMFQLDLNDFSRCPLRTDRCPFRGHSHFNWDVSETDSGYLVHADLPGMNKDNISIELENGMLTVQAKNDNIREETNDTYHFKERRFGSFKRQFQLPETVDEESVRGTYDNGVLTITLNKIEKYNTRRRIQID